MMGIGGTGVVTVNQILGTAALLDGKHVRGLDQTGLSQKGGPVVSHLKIADAAARGLEQDRGRRGRLLPGLRHPGGDLARRTSITRGRTRTIAVVSTSQVPTGAMVTHTDVHFPEASGLQQSIDRVTRKDENVYLDALGPGRDALRRSHGVQHDRAGRRLPGRAPSRSAPTAIEEAIELNGVSVAMNTHAFRAGRLLVVDPALAGDDQRAPRLGAGRRRRRALTPARRARWSTAVGARGRAAAPPRDPGARADRVPERALRAPATSSSCARARRPSGRRARRDAA